MRRFIYLDTDTLNSYIAQIFDGLIKEEQEESTASIENEKINTTDIGLEGKLSMIFFGKGVEGTPSGAYQYLKRLEDQNIIKDVQTKVMHDNAFDLFMSYLENGHIDNRDEIGSFKLIKDSFHIIDLNFYKSLFSEEGFAGKLKEINKKNARKSLEEAFSLKNREFQRNSQSKSELNKQIKMNEEKIEKEFSDTQVIIDMLRSIIPYQQFLCIDKYLVVFDEKYFRDDISKVAFKYGGKINVLGYVTNKVINDDSESLDPFSNLLKQINVVLKYFIDKSEEMYVLHPVAIYYDN